MNPGIESTRLGVMPGDPPMLQNHPTQSATTIDRWKSVLLALPFLFCGAFTLSAAFDLMTGQKHAPTWVIALIGSFFSLGGVFFLMHGVRGVVREARNRRELRSRPEEPWLADYPWRREGFAFSAFNAMLSPLFSAVLWYAFLTPFLWVGLTQRGLGRVFLFGVGWFALIGLSFWARWAKMLGDFLRHGNSFLEFDSFPYFLGTGVQARPHPGPPL